MSQVTKTANGYAMKPNNHWRADYILESDELRSQCDEHEIYDLECVRDAHNNSMGIVRNVRAPATALKIYKRLGV